MEINENQREGLAKVADNLATASMVAAIAGGIVDHKIGLAATCALFVMFLVLLFIAPPQGNPRFQSREELRVREAHHVV